MGNVFRRCSDILGMSVFLKNIWDILLGSCLQKGISMKHLFINIFGLSKLHMCAYPKVGGDGQRSKPWASATIEGA